MTDLNAAGMEVGIDSDGDEGLNSVLILREVLGISEEPAERTRNERASSAITRQPAAAQRFKMFVIASRLFGLKEKLAFFSLRRAFVRKLYIFWVC